MRHKDASRAYSGEDPDDASTGSLLAPDIVFPALPFLRGVEDPVITSSKTYCPILQGNFSQGEAVADWPALRPPIVRRVENKLSMWS